MNRLIFNNYCKVNAENAGEEQTEKTLFMEYKVVTRNKVTFYS